MIVSLGIPLDENSSFLRGAANGPSAIRDAFRSVSANYFSENGVDLSNQSILEDRGDLRLSSMPRAFHEIKDAVRKELNAGHKVISFGGDHSVTFPLVQAFAEKYKSLNILHIDAHGDLYDEFEGNKLSHACPFARIMEEKLATRLVQVGIRTLTTHQRQQADRFNVEIFEMKDWSDTIQLEFKDPVYISLDLDGLDPAFAPGVSHYEPGGLSTRQVINMIQRLKGMVVGADIVELNPERDINGMTAMVAARLYKELASRMLSD